jgi:predicted phage terminase large subunit-like protein
MNNQSPLLAVLRQDLNAFIHKSFLITNPGEAYHSNWHIQTLAWYLKQCAEGKITRLIITLPPRHLKSHCVSVAFVAWLLGHDPSRKIIVASYSQELAKSHAMKCRMVMESPIFQKTFPGTVIHPNKCTETEVMTTMMGSRYSTSVLGSLTGRGGNLIIVDDPIKPADAMSESQRPKVNEWFDSTLYSRLDNKKTDVIIVVMQRIHQDDLVGHLLARGGWVTVDIPAIAVEARDYRIDDNRSYPRAAGEVLDAAREPQLVLDQIKENIGAYTFQAQYQQEPAPTGGTLFNWAGFRTYEKPPLVFDFLVQSWDPASKLSSDNSYSVCTTWGVIGDDCYLLHVVRERLEYPALKKRVLDHAFTMEAGVVIIEDTSAGISLLQDFDADKQLKAWPKQPRGDKIARAEKQTSKIEAGRVFLPAAADWLKEYRREIIAFPGSQFSDQVDSTVNFLESLPAVREKVRVHGRYHALCALNTPKPGYGATAGVGRITRIGAYMPDLW